MCDLLLYVPSCSNASVRNTGLSIIPLTFGTEGAQRAVTHNETFTGSRLDQQVGSSFFFDDIQGNLLSYIPF